MTNDPRRAIRPRIPPATTAPPLVTPLWANAAFRARDADHFDAQYEGREPGFTYAREGHPNAVVLSQKIDALHNLEPDSGGGVLCASGMAAISAIFLGLLNAGDHVVAGNQLYGRSLRQLREDLPRFGVETSFADATDAASVAAAIRPETRLIHVETVANPTLRIADIEGLAEIARARDVLLSVDNTFATPRGFRPFDHGADIVMESVTKLLAGHSDATLGWVAGRTPELNDIFATTTATFGGCAAPFDCWLAERGLATFPLRYDRAEENAAALAEHLSHLPQIERVFYPGRRDHPDHDRAYSLLQGRYGSMVSFRLKGGRAEANRFLRALNHANFAATLGDVSTVVSHSASSSHRGMTPKQREAQGVTEGFIRVSVGVEEIEILIEDFSEALRAIA